MSDAAGVDIPDLKKLHGKRDEERRFGAALRVAAAGLIAAGAVGGPRAYRHWRDGRVDLSGVRSTIHPSTRNGSVRLALAAEAFRGEFGPGYHPVPEHGDNSRDWVAALRLARPEPGARSIARALSRSALAQLRVTDAVSGSAAARGRAEDAAAASHDAFAQQLTAEGPASALRDALAQPVRGPSAVPAPDVTAPGRNVTPYQDMLDRAYADARDAAALRRKAPAALAAGAALLAAGRAMLGVPGASLAARGLLAAGAAATARGLRQTAEARRKLAHARELVDGIRLLQGQKAQAGLAEACIELVARGEKLDRCRADAPAMTAFVRRSVDRELSDQPAWEVEGGSRVAALPE